MSVSEPVLLSAAEVEAALEALADLVTDAELGRWRTANLGRKSRLSPSTASRK